MNKEIVKKMGIAFFIVLCLVIFIVYNNSNNAKLINVYTVQNTLAQRARIIEEDIVGIELPYHLVTEDMVASKEEIIGKYVSLSNKIYPGQVIMRQSIEDIEQAQDKPILLLKDNQKLMTIKADLVTTGGNSLGENQYVDIVYIDKYKKENAKTILKNVRIVGVKNRKGEDVNDEGVPYVIMLAITDTYITNLVTAMEVGNISLIGVSSNDLEECILGESVNFDEL